MNDVKERRPTGKCRCGHPVSHHDAGECWTAADGHESRNVTCGCWAYDETLEGGAA